ncbi:MAG: hypothetical protein NVS4B3_23940 [Gemmatimonadaceae bacterium]
MRVILALAAGSAIAGAVACGSRQVEVRTAPQASADMSNVAVHMTNNLNQAVNVYVTSGGTDIFVAQVSPMATRHLPVRGVAAGSVVTLKATTADGASTYTKSNVTLGGSMYPWQVP